MNFRHLRRLVATLLASLGLLAGLPASAGQWAFDLYANIWGAREYQTWLPSGYRAGTPLPMVLVLHGCVTDPNSTALVSRFNELADRENFIVVYPRQNVTSNPSRCWNFMLPVNQARGSGEPSILMGIVNRVKSRYSVDNARVYVTGISAGGAMTSTLAACYSEVFAAAAVHSGGMYKGGVGLVTSAESLLLGSPYDPDVRGRDAWKCAGSPRRLMPMLVFHGTSDLVVNPLNGDQTVQQFVQTNDLGDDGQDNDSARYLATSITRHSAPVPGGRSYTVATFHSSAGVVVAQKYTVEGMNHAWSGGPPVLPFSDERGPDATGISWDFFKNYRR
ncbi:MAG: PHB depolymerase family esterase [Ramlibacter sp.]|nr:PHB depolymerase family esterase [Ramlibacter sp.]